MPTTDNNILAISSGFKRYHTQFSHTDLLGCHQINNIYLCQRMGSLFKNLSSTCLGSLYQQQFDSVKQLCPLEIRKTEEVVHPLLNNWFLAFSPEVQTAPIQCRNGTQSEIYLQRGINKLFISPGCRCILNEHIVTSYLNVKMDSDIIHYEWSWDRISLDDFELESLAPHLNMMEAAGLKRPTFQDLQTLKMESARSPGWIAHYIYMTGLSILGLLIIFATIYAGYYYYVFILKCRSPCPRNETEMLPLSVQAPQLNLPHVELPSYHHRQ